MCPFHRFQTTATNAVVSEETFQASASLQFTALSNFTHMHINKSTYPYDIQYEVFIRIFVIRNKISIYFIYFGKTKQKEETKKLEKETAQNVLMLAISIREIT